MRLGSGDPIFKTRQRPLFTHSYTQTQRKNNNNKFSSHLQILHATMACTGNSTHIQKEEKKFTESYKQSKGCTTTNRHTSSETSSEV